MRGLSFILDTDEFFQPGYRSAIEDSLADHALYDVTKAFGFRDQDAYLEALMHKGVGVKALILKRLAKRGIKI